MTWTDVTDDTQSWSDADCWLLKGGLWDDNCTWFDSLYWIDGFWTDGADDTQTWSDA